MRINSGILGGRVFKVPKDGMRPTMEQAREGVFSSLAARVPEARVLDLFAGSGSLGLEAWSRGAASVTAVEKVSKYWKILQENFQALEGDPDLGGWQAVQADAYEYLKRSPGCFDLIFADPPYAWAQENGFAELASLLKSRELLRPGGIFVAEHSTRKAAEIWPGWELLRDREYGQTRLAVYRLLPPAVTQTAEG